MLSTLAGLVILGTNSCSDERSHFTKKCILKDFGLMKSSKNFVINDELPKINGPYGFGFCEGPDGTKYLTITDSSRETTRNYITFPDSNGDHSNNVFHSVDIPTNISPRLENNK